MVRPGPRVRSLAALFYFFYFASVGITLPFLPAFLTKTGLRATQVGILLALSPALSLVAPPLWGRLADRTRRPNRVLAVLALGSALLLIPMLRARAFLPLGLVFLGYACFAGSTTPLIDSMTLAQLEKEGGSFARVRLFGSAGFVLAASAFGIFAPPGSGATIVLPALLLGLCAACALRFPRGPKAAAPNKTPPLKRLKLWTPEVVLFLGACCLHWMACAPYHGDFAIHVAALGLPSSVVGVAAGLGVLAEVGVMAAYPLFARRLRTTTVLCVAFLASAVRWWGMALATTGVPIILLTLLHGLTFGAFYVAAVDTMSRRGPPDSRAQTQAVFASVTFGLGGLVGYLVSGLGYDVLGARHLFMSAAGLEVLATAAVLVSASLADTAAPRAC